MARATRDYELTVEDQSRNGVRVLVRRHVRVTWAEVEQLGTTVEADCACYGIVGRVHSREDCPLRQSLLP